MIEELASAAQRLNFTKRVAFCEKVVKLSGSSAPSTVGSGTPSRTAPRPRGSTAPRIASRRTPIPATPFASLVLFAGFGRLRDIALPLAGRCMS
jgi:hypothetical protein